MTDEQMRERVLSYLYGMMTPAEEDSFHADVTINADLAQLLAQEQSFQQQLPIGSEPELSDELLAQNRLRLRAALRKQPHAPQDVRSSWDRLMSPVLNQMERMIPRMLWASGGAALLVSGIILGRTVLVPAATTSGAELVGQLVDVHVQSFDRSTGQVRLELSTLVTSQLHGDLGDPRVQTALTTALQDGMGPGPRLQAVELLRLGTVSASARLVLSHALLHDDNPGVRIAAAGALSGLAQDDDVRQALHRALLDDTNPGVRVAAVEGLRSFRDHETRQVLEQAIYFESNQYIRAEARRTLDGWVPAAAHL